MPEKLLDLPFSLEDERLSTLLEWTNPFGQTYYTLRAISHEITDGAYAVTPNDPLFNQQWHLNDTYGVNIQETWEDYRGAGVRIGLVDDGVQYTHPDIAGNYNASIDFDGETGTGNGAPQDADDRHGTTTGGTIVGDGDNGQGITGVAYEAELANFRLDFGTNFTDAQFASLYTQQLAADVDISNNSWGFGGFFGDDFKDTMPLLGDSIEALAMNGRDGLGASVIVSAGNGRSEGQNTNYHNLQNSQYVTSVAATDQNGDITSFSTPGAAVLVSAPGVDITSTDRTGADGYVSGDYASGLGGTSYSAPIVSGIVALMLEANPNLGYRDVQEILAYSARNSDPGDSSWQFNGADNWNGGGLHYSHDYGFGLVDALAAVRLAESWDASGTYANRDMVSSGQQNVFASIPDNNSGGISDTVTLNSDLTIDKVEIDINIDHTQIGDLIVRLTSPDGTTSTLVDRPGVTSGWFGGSGSSQDDIEFTLTSNAFWGEDGDGQWELEVIDANRRQTGSLHDWSLRLYGDDASANDTYLFTNEYAESLAASSARGSLSDTGGSDLLNLAAVSSDTTLSLLSGEGSLIDGAAFTIASGTQIENAWLGDGNDSITGNAAANNLMGARGDDWLMGGGGNDSLSGSAGQDIAAYTGAFTDYLVNIVDDMTLTIMDMFSGDGDEGSDWLYGVERLQFANGTYLFDGDSITEEAGPPPPPPPPPPPENEAPMANNDSATLDENSSVLLDVLFNDTDPEDDPLVVSDILDGPDHGSVTVNADNTITYTPDADYDGSDEFLYEVSDGNGNHDSATVSLTIEAVEETNDPSMNIRGGRGNDVLEGGSNDDTLEGWRGNDDLSGKGGNDYLYGDYGNDTLYGGSGDDILEGGRNNNSYIGGEGIDLLISFKRGADTFIFEKLSDAGDVIQGFDRGDDVLDLTGLFDDIGYGGSNPVADGIMLLTPGSGGDLIVSIDADGPGGSSPIALANLDGLGSTTLTLGVDYII